MKILVCLHWKYSYYCFNGLKYSNIYICNFTTTKIYRKAWDGPQIRTRIYVSQVVSILAANVRFQAPDRRCTLYGGSATEADFSEYFRFPAMTDKHASSRLSPETGTICTHIWGRSAKALSLTPLTLLWYMKTYYALYLFPRAESEGRRSDLQET
jgi:hypothetical protein